MKKKYIASFFIVVLSASCSIGQQSKDPASYEAQAASVQRALDMPVYPQKAKNIILFVGDGMGVSTITAARILDGQIRGETGEENVLSFEQLDHLALSKTYNSNSQVPDSAGTMTAMVTGHKTKQGIISYSQEVVRGDHTSTKDFGGDAKPLKTILQSFEEMGKSSGLVTTSRITHATPASCYAHSADRNWENDRDIKQRNKEAYSAGVKDIALQLIEMPYGDGVDVALGGGRRSFLPSDITDPEDEGTQGVRLDGRNLINEWVNKKDAIYVWNKQQFDDIDTVRTKKLLGLFERSHMQYEHDRTSSGQPSEPSLAEMTVTAIRILRNNPNGFFLNVEGGRIDHGHHAGNAYRALIDTIAFADAVAAALKELSEEEKKNTLIIVTADHSHTLTIGGYSVRGNPILGKALYNDAAGNPKKEIERDMLGLPFTALAYANGGGYTGPMINVENLEILNGGQKYRKEFGGPLSSSSGKYEYIKVPHPGRPDLTKVDTTDPDYIQEALIPLTSETHAGEDVPIFAQGPGAYLFRGVREQNYIFHVMETISE